LLNNDLEQLVIIVEGYETEIRENVRQIPDLIASGDASGFRRRAHMLAGAMRQLGAANALEVAITLENRAAAEELGGCDKLVSELTRASEHVLTELREFIRASKT
jgi:HPt (histidine-containing phosphotransfer) domain-containing protein